MAHRVRKQCNQRFLEEHLANFKPYVDMIILGNSMMMPEVLMMLFLVTYCAIDSWDVINIAQYSTLQVEIVEFKVIWAKTQNMFCVKTWKNHQNNANQTEHFIHTIIKLLVQLTHSWDFLTTLRPSVWR